ncbi:MAG: hypothetical protein HND58_11040 [Planctomycetota bacterium]|nr:MAG: hypothetical protein HND58_11040 [Planctomycetota bacterium]
MHPVYRSRPPFSRWLALTLGALPLAAAYSQPASQTCVVRAGFEQGLDGWTIGEVSGVTPDAYLVTRTSDGVWAGRHAVRFASTTANPGYQTAWTELPVVIEDGLPRVVRLRVQARTEHANELPAIWLRVDGPDGMLAVQTSFTPSPAAATWHSREMSIAVPPSAHTVLVGVGLVGAGRADFDEVEATLHDPADLPPPTAVAADYLDHALDRMQAAALHRAVLDWEHIRDSAHHLARGGTVPADTHAAIGYALAQLQDGHSSFIPASARQASNRFSPWSGAPSGRSLPSGVHVIEVPALTSGTPEENLEYATHLRALLEAAAAAPGLVIDLRNNTGGNMWPMLAGVAPLLGQRTVGGIRSARGAAHTVVRDRQRSRLRGCCVHHAPGVIAPPVVGVRAGGGAHRAADRQCRRGRAVRVPRSGRAAHLWPADRRSVNRQRLDRVGRRLAAVAHHRRLCRPHRHAVR